MSQQETQPPELAELARQALSGRVAREVTHRINGLLVGVVSVATEALTGKAAIELRHALETNAEYGQRIAELVQEFQRLFPESPPSPLGPANLTAALDRCVSVCRKLATGRGIKIEKHYGSLPWVQADIGPLEQVVIELLYTALDATSGEGAIELTAEPRGDVIAVTVSTGARVSTNGNSSWLADISDAIRLSDRLDGGYAGGDLPDESGRGPTATSLGLAITISAIRQNGGEIAAQCPPGNASQLTITWPIHAGEQ